MNIFRDEFKTKVKSILFCSWRGHKKGKWIDTYWAIAHYAGRAQFCQRCGLKLNSKPFPTIKTKTTTSKQ